MTDWAARFPVLFRPRFEGYADADLEFRLGAPPDHEVSRLHLVALDGDGLVVVCRSVEEWRFLPGGRRGPGGTGARAGGGWRFLPGGGGEPGETVAETARRELREEAGCTLLGDLGPVFAHQRA